MNYNLLLFLLIITSCTPKVVQNARVEDLNEQTMLINKYAELLEVPKDSIYNLRLYRNLDQWKNTKDLLNFKNIPFSTLFIDYMCYRQYNMTLPDKYDDIFKNDNVYLYLNTDYLTEGDLVFFQDKYRPVKSIGFYLRNKYFVSASPNGDIVYYHVRDTLNQIKIISNAKLNKEIDETNQPKEKDDKKGKIGAKCMQLIN